MPDKTLLSIIESPTHPDFSRMYKRLDFVHDQVSSMRKALAYVKKSTPDYVVAEFFYGYGNNYAGVNISNLDVFLYSLEKYSPATKVIAIVHKAERQYAEHLNDIIPYHAILQHPVRESELEALLTG